MPVMMPSSVVYAEEGGVQLRAILKGGCVEVSIISDERETAKATIARWRWDRIVQAMSPLPDDLT